MSNATSTPAENPSDRQTSDTTIGTAIIQTPEPQYGLSDMQIDALMRPIHSSRVKPNRDGFSYVEAWDVKAALIRIFGFGGFSTDVIDWRELRRAEVPQRNNKDRMNWQVTVAVTLRVTIHQTGATYTEAATGTNSQPDFGKAFDSALKSAESYALKRACVQLGTQFGMSLYDNGSKRDVVKVVLAPDQLRNVPTSLLTPEEKAKANEQIDRAFTVAATEPGKGAHEDRLIEDQDVNEAYGQGDSRREQYEQESHEQADQ